MPRASLLAILFALATSCTTGGSAEVDGGTTTDAGPPGTDAPIPLEDQLTTGFGPQTLAVGEERTVCVVVELDNTTPRVVRAIRASLPVGSHHMIIYRTTEDVRDTPFPCFSFSDGDAILGVQQDMTEIVYPDEAGLTFTARQHIRLEIHQVNYTEAPLDITASVTFELYPEGDPARAEVEYLFTGNTALSLPPHEVTTITSFHAVPDGAHLIAVASHTHSLGTHASIARSTSSSDVGTLLHESTDWAHPPFDQFDPGLVLDADEGLRLECTFENTTERTVNFGLEFADEMCFLGCYYY